MKELKKAAFWKSAVFGLNCIRQEYAVYEELAGDRRFDMSKFLKKAVERFWKAATVCLKAWQTGRMSVFRKGWQQS